MKKVLAGLAKVFFTLFGLAIIGLLMTLTWGALVILFPNSFSNRLWGMVLFDVAAIAWALAFVFNCRSTGQYVAAAAGFITGFLGSILMAAADVVLGGQTFVDSSDMGRYMVYGFIGATVIHAALVYFYHASAPEIHAQIEMGIAEGEIQTEAIRNATQNLNHNRPEYARQIQGRIINDSLRHLDIPIAVDPEIGFVQVPPPEVKAATVANPGKSSPWRFWERNRSAPPPVLLEQTVKAEEPPASKSEPVQTNKKQEDADPGDAPFPGVDSG